MFAINCVYVIVVVVAAVEFVSKPWISEIAVHCKQFRQSVIIIIIIFVVITGWYTQDVDTHQVLSCRLWSTQLHRYWI